MNGMSISLRLSWPLCCFSLFLLFSESLGFVGRNIPPGVRIDHKSVFYCKESLGAMDHDDRRSALRKVSQSIAFLSLLLGSNPAYADLENNNNNEKERSKEMYRLPPITHRVYMDVRIARQDGTFYVRDDPPGTIPTPENQVFYGRLTFGLFGTIAPLHVQKFLTYVNVTYFPGEDDEAPLPSYARSVFNRLDQRTGLLEGGAIPGLELTTVGGSSALQYGSRIIPAQLWITQNSNRISHSASDLLTHRDLDVTPVFGITTRAAPELDSSHTVFGCLLRDESSTAFLERVIDLPTYSIDRTYVDQENAIVDAASNLYTIQKDFFRQAAKVVGDSRLEKTFDGKLLRRVEVTQVGFVSN